MATLVKRAESRINVTTGEDVVRQFYKRIGYEVEDQIVMSRWMNGRQV